MDRTNDGRRTHRGTILVASSSAMFAELVGEMVARCDFAPAYLAPLDEVGDALRRTRPRIVICDCATPPDGIRRLIVEASARRLPLVLSDPRVSPEGHARTRSLAHAVAWLTFPISYEPFCRMLDALLATPIDAQAALSRPLGRSEHTLEARSPSETADEQDLRSVIATALGAKPVDEQALRHGVWTYVTAERTAGASPGQVVVALTDLVEDANITPLPVRRALLRDVMLWCVEAYFGHLGNDAVGRDGPLPDDTPAAVPGG
jgi:hypothetical protein